ncbi:MAG: TetR/AcrR family transcriptional regulator [Bacteroidetes bacterium]|nr:TetR/AcrR family transcriptional regulator [Bacteroidota bacterium]MBS1629307.1 TetR/AcrR family transcriptional regulator [Bacteroidota bacterium]
MDTQSKIASVAIEAFSQYGFKTITMDDIARKAGISKKTLYQHYRSKTEVVEAAMKWHSAMLDEVLELQMNESANAVEAMVRVNAILAQMYRQINPIALLELERFFPSAYKSFREKLLNKDIAKIRDNIIRGIEEGLYRADADADLLACYRLESCLVVFQPNSLITKNYPPHVASRAIMENFLYGLLTNKGRTLYQKYADKYLKETPRI